MTDGIRIGIFICHCGSNIGGTVDVPDVVEYARTLPYVACAEGNLYTCSEDGLSSIRNKIKEHELNRVVVASCTPRTHEGLFRKNCERADLNKYLFEFVNLREHCSWVHMNQPGEATAKAKDLVRMGAAKVALLEPLTDLSTDVTRACLVLGGGVSGLNSALALGQFMHTRYRSRAKSDSVFPSALPSSAPLIVQDLQVRRSTRGVEIKTDFHRGDFKVESRWFFHAARPWIDIAYRLRDGWSDDPQTVQFCFPFALTTPTYRYDAPGAILTAGPQHAGGDDLPGANPELFAGLTFASASGDERSILVLAPDTLLWQFGPEAVRAEGDSTSTPPTLLTSMPMMNLTGNDWQFGQGGWRDWRFRYRVVLADGPFDPLRAVQEAQQFATAPFLDVPGQEPAVPGLKAFDIEFSGGPLLAFKVAQDDQRLVLRFWNVSNHTCDGTLRLPAGWTKAEICDALERPKTTLKTTDNQVLFSARPAEILTLALAR